MKDRLREPGFQHYDESVIARSTLREKYFLGCCGSGEVLEVPGVAGRAQSQRGWLEAECECADLPARANAKCEVRSALRTAEWGSGVCRTPNAERRTPNAECGLPGSTTSANCN